VKTDEHITKAEEALGCVERDLAYRRTLDRPPKLIYELQLQISIAHSLIVIAERLARV
jgi:hypothetical protein